MSSREREGWISRIRQVRRLAATSNKPTGASAVNPEQDALHALEARLAHVEQLVQGLQDSVHRESSRISKRVGDLETRVQPSALSRALSEDARERGL